MSSVRIVVALAEVQYDEMMRIIELIYGGKIDVPKTSWPKFTAAAKVLKINGFDKLGDISPEDIEKTFTMRNCYVRLTDVTEKLNKNAPPNEVTVTENTPPNSAPGTPFALLDAVAGTLETGSVTANTPATSEQSTPNSCDAVPEVEMADLEVVGAPTPTHQPKASKRSSTGRVPSVHPKKNRFRLHGLNDSSDSDSPVVPTASKPSFNRSVALCHPKKNPLRDSSDSDRPLVPATKINPGKLNKPH